MDSLSHRFAAEALCHQTDLLRAATRLLGASDRAEDVLQDTMLVAWRKFPAYEPGTNCRAWLFQILQFCVQRSRQRNGFVSLLDQYSVPPVLPEVDLMRAIAKLPPPFRRVIELADIEERTYQDVSRRLRIPIGTVMSRLHRARIQLRSDLSFSRPLACRRLARG